MFWIALLIGLGAGFTICFAWQLRLRQKVRGILYAHGNYGSQVPSLAPLSSLRRELKSLRDEAQHLRADVDQCYLIFEKLPCGYLHIDADNQLLWCNQKARQLLLLNRWQSGEVRLLLELVRSYELDQLIEQTRLTKQSKEQEWEFHPSRDAQTSADRDNSIHLKGSTIALRDNEVGVFLEDQEDVYIVKQAQETLLSDLTHELRTPLTAMRLVAETLVPRLKGQDQKWMGQLLREINRLYYLVQDWLEISRLASHPHQVLSHQTFDLVPLIHEVWETLAPIAIQKNIELSYLGAEQCKIEGDRDRLTQVLFNLFDNAIKYNPVHMPVCVNLNQPAPMAPDKIILDVVDQGSGFVTEDLPYVFERLYRGDQSRVRQPESGKFNKGSGLGLAIVQQIVASHDGEIIARNHPDHGGAWLQIHLPTTVATDELDL